MDKQQIIADKIAQLSGETGREFDQTSQAFIASSAELQEELAFIEALWQPDSLQTEQPSSQLDQAFYTMLSQAQTSQTLSRKQHGSNNWLAKLKNALSLPTLKSAFSINNGWQLASLVLVFMLGYNLNHQAAPNKESGELLALNQQVSSLSTLMAVSLLQQSSASERLSGVAYSQQANLNDPQLSSLLLDSLQHDRSVPVKLAIINSLNNNDFSTIESQLITLFSHEPNVLVQIELCRLLFTQGSAKGRKQLSEQLSASELHPDMQRFVAQLNKQIQA